MRYHFLVIVSLVSILAAVPTESRPSEPTTVVSGTQIEPMGGAQIEPMKKKAVYFVSPNGSPTGNGSKKHPWDLATALSGPAQVKPGSTVYLRAGRYVGRYVSSLAGVEGQPITVRSYPGEWSVIDGYKYTTLAQAIDATQTSVTLADASGFKGFPGGANVRVDNEIMMLNRPSGNGFNDVLRGAAKTSGSATSHSQGATVLLCGNILTINGSDTIFRDLEVMNSDPARIDLVNNPDTLGFELGDDVSIYGVRTKMINCVVHDGIDGITAWAPASDSEIYGNIVYNVGDVQSDRTHGHGLYQENAAGTRLIADNIVLNSFNLNAQCYGVTGPFVGGTLDGNVFFGAGSPYNAPDINLLVGTKSQSIPSVTVTNNYFYHQAGVGAANLILGYGGVTEGSATVTGNYIVGGVKPLSIVLWQSVVFQQNTIVGYNPSDQSATLALNQPGGTSYSWDNNTYYDVQAPTGCTEGGDRRTPFSHMYRGVVSTGVCGNALSFSEWKSSINADGISNGDANSTYSESTPLKNAVFVRKNFYEPGRANIIIFNWKRRGSVAVDVSSVLASGDQYEVRSAENYLGRPILTGVYSGGEIRIPMLGATVASPVGMKSAPPPTEPVFGVFVIRKTS